jgi:hypothetical protein
VTKCRFSGQTAEIWRRNIRHSHWTVDTDNMSKFERDRLHQQPNLWSSWTRRSSVNDKETGFLCVVARKASFRVPFTLNVMDTSIHWLLKWPRVVSLPFNGIKYWQRRFFTSQFCFHTEEWVEDRSDEVFVDSSRTRNLVKRMNHDFCIWNNSDASYYTTLGGSYGNYTGRDGNTVFLGQRNFQVKRLKCVKCLCTGWTFRILVFPDDQNRFSVNNWLWKCFW